VSAVTAGTATAVCPAAYPIAIGGGGSAIGGGNLDRSYASLGAGGAPANGVPATSWTATNNGGGNITANAVCAQ
jgi:hypothetical protein